MKIGLLKCGKVHPELYPVYGDYDGMFKVYFSRYIPSIDLDVFDIVKGDYPPTLSGYDGFVSSGSLSAVYDNDKWIKEYQRFVVKLYEEQCKHVGICFGHQMIAQALGGKVERSERGWGMGIKKLSIYDRTSWTDNDKKEIYLISSHQDQVTVLPKKARLLAGNSHCPFGIFSVDDHVFAIQSHPEFTITYHKASVELRRKSVSPDIIQQALNSMTKQTDEKIVAGWIKNFFEL